MTTASTTDTRRFTPQQIAITVAKRLVRYAELDSNWEAVVAERGIELAEDGAFTITTEGGQTFHLAVTDRTPTCAAKSRGGAPCTHKSGHDTPHRAEIPGGSFTFHDAPGGGR